MRCYSMEPRMRKQVKGYGFLSFARKLPTKYGKQLLDTRLDILKNAFTEVVYKGAEATGEFVIKL